MIFGLTPFVAFHTAITLVAIVSGLLMLAAMLRNDRADLMTAIFLLFSVLTAVTGFMIQVKPVSPAVALGFVLGGLLLFALLGRYVFAMRGAWRWIYVVTAVAALWSNCFVLVVQTFSKFPALHAIAPGNPPSGPVFGAVQGVVLIGFIFAGYLALRRFHPRPTNG
ncbi:MAG TPA: hypothetical protein VHZ78_07355 [Rhizomicrobium sp.]|jgi:hypothetical protein|nr:hypothetical protein [Rhizomicrobium sp.]